jgi:hypothetical protein
MNVSIPVLALAAVISSGCSQPVSPSGPMSGLGGELAADAVPFRGTLEGTFTFVPEAAPSTFAAAHLHASGVATQLGRFTLDAPHRVDLSTVVATGQGTFEMTAANGDRLTGQLLGLGTPTDDPVVYSVEETYTVTGGTGRFADASGSFTARRIVNLATLVTTGTLEGTVSRSHKVVPNE